MRTSAIRKLLSLVLSVVLAAVPAAAGTAASALAAAEKEPAVLLPDGVLDYTSGVIHLNQYASQPAGGVYFLRDRQLSFYSLATSESRVVHTFPASEYHEDGRFYGSQDRVSSYVKDGVLYFMYNAWRNTYSEDEVVHVARYDMDAGALLEEVTVSGHIGCAVGVDDAGRIYLGVDDYFSDNAPASPGRESKGVLVLDDRGKLLTQSLSEAEEDRIYAFNGFRPDGSFFYTAWADYLYWGYHHDMMTLYAGSLLDGRLSLRQKQLDYLCQFSYYQYQNGAELLDGRYLALKNGRVYDTDAPSEDGYATVLYAPRERDEALPNDTYDLSAVGARMRMADESSLLAYTSGRNIFRYDLDSGEQTARYVASHFVFSLLDMGDRFAAVETEGGAYYLEIFSADDCAPLTTLTLDLNQTESYKGHTAEAVRSRWAAAKIDPDTDVFEALPSLQAPYAEGVYTAEMKNSLLGYSNYLRWLGGLTPFAEASAADVRNAGRGAVVLAASGQFDHNPVKDETLADMDDAFFADGCAGTAGSNLSWGGSADRADGYMSAIRGLLDDVSNVSAFELGHRFTFLQRAGSRLAYGSAGTIMCQTVKALDNQENVTGTVQGVDNNDYAYCWPAPGAFPVEEISTEALWSINFNDDKVQFSNKPLTLTITDLDTGEVVVDIDTFGSSQYMGSGMGWFYGKCIYFAGPDVDSYMGKNYKVELHNLAAPDGQPLEMTYTINFITAENKADYTKVEAAVQKAQALDPGLYANFDRVTAAVQAVNWNLAADRQEIVDGYAAAIEEALQELIMRGDLDADGAVTIADVMEACKILARKSADLPPSEDERLRGDLDGDGDVSIADVMEICKILARKG